MSRALEWLGRRRPPGPDPLEAAMVRSVTRSEPPDAAVAAALARAALTGLQTVVARPSTRSTALDLLTVDALMTHACEAAAEAGEAALDELLASLSPERFGALLHPAEER